MMKPVYKIVFFISIALVVASISVMAIFGLNLGIDFNGGTLIGVSYHDRTPTVNEIQEALKSYEFKEIRVTSGDDSLLIRLPKIDDEMHDQILNDLATLGDFEEQRFDLIGPTIGDELKTKTIYAIIFVFIGITIYIAYVFRKLSEVLSPWAMGLAAILALIHDVIVPLGIFTLLSQYYGIEISAVFVAAILTILGYSVSDSVVIFDRARENVVRYGEKGSFADIMHKSVMQTLSRSINTSLTTLLPLFAIFLFGGDTLKFFSLFLIIGIFLGAYSSLFVASPLLVWLSKKHAK